MSMFYGGAIGPGAIADGVIRAALVRQQIADAMRGERVKVWLQPSGDGPRRFVAELPGDTSVDVMAVCEAAFVNGTAAGVIIETFDPAGGRRATEIGF